MNMGSMSSGSHSDSSTSSSHGMMSMPLVFTNSHTTPLFSSVWTPWNNSGYAGTCIFLIFFAIISRLLRAWRRQLELMWLDDFVNKRSSIDSASRSRVASHPTEKSEEATLTAREVDERIKVLLAARAGAQIMPWSLRIDIPRASIFTVQVGVSYLLVVAVVTLNVGYFLSVLGGMFLGEVFLGRYLVSEGDHVLAI